MFAAWGHLVYRWRWATLGLSSVLLALSVVVLAQGGDLASGGIIETSESGLALQLLKEELPTSSGSSFSVIFASASLSATDPAFRSALEFALDEVKRDPRVASVRTPYDATPPLPAFISSDG